MNRRRQILDNSFLNNVKEEVKKENIEFTRICNSLTSAIIVIYIVLFVISMIIDTFNDMKIGFTIKFPGMITLAIMGIFVVIYWLPKIIIVFMRCLNKRK